jgi:hypothetical protein
MRTPGIAVAHTADIPDTLSAIGMGSELSTQITHMVIDTAIHGADRAPKGLLRESVARDTIACMAKQYNQQIELC